MYRYESTIDVGGYVSDHYMYVFHECRLRSIPWNLHMSSKSQSQAKDTAGSKQQSPRSSSEQTPLEENTAPALIHSRMKQNPDLLAPRDLLYLQRTFGNQTTDRVLRGHTGTELEEGSKEAADAPAHRLPAVSAASPSPDFHTVIQRKPEHRLVSGITHLVEMKNKTLLGGKEGQTVWDGDVITIDDEDKYRSRRGIDAETDKDEYRDEPHAYQWFRALKVNDKDVSGKRFYIRGEMLTTLNGTDADSALSTARENEARRGILNDAIDLTEHALALGQTASDLVDELEESLEATPDTFDTTQAEEALEQTRGEIDTKVFEAAGETRDHAEAELGRPTQRDEETGALFERAKAHNEAALGMLSTIAEQSVTYGREVFSLASKNEADVPHWADILSIGDRAHDAREAGIQRVNQTVTNLSSSTKEIASTVWGYFNNAFDIFGIVAASVEGLAAITAVSVTVATVGAVLGAIAAAAGFYFAHRTGKREKELEGLRGALEEGNVDENVVNIAEYARDQKRRKKKRMRAVGVAGITVGALALIGLAGGPIGIAMASLAAAIGVGFIIYKAWKKYRGKTQVMQALVAGARNGDQEKITALKKLGIRDDELTDLDNKSKRKALKTKVERLLKDRRVKAASDLVQYVLTGKPSQKVAAEKIVSALGIKPDKIRNKYNEDTAVSRVASKLASW